MEGATSTHENQTAGTLFSLETLPGCVGGCCVDEFLMHLLWFWCCSLRTRNSSLEGAVKLKFAPFAPLEMPFPMVSFFVDVKFFRFWPKTMDYSQAF